MKKQEQKTKRSSLTTSVEKYQAEHGSGSCSTDSATDTGNHIAAILLPKKDLSSPLVSQSTFQSDVMFPFPTKNLNQGANGLSGETRTKEAILSDLLNHPSLSAWKTLYLRTKSDKPDT